MKRLWLKYRWLVASGIILAFVLAQPWGLDWLVKSCGVCAFGLVVVGICLVVR